MMCATIRRCVTKSAHARPYVTPPSADSPGYDTLAFGAMIPAQRPSACPFAGAANASISDPRDRRDPDETHDPFVSVDANGTIVAWNARAEIVFGWTREQAIGRQANDLIVPEALRDRHRTTLANYLFGRASAIVDKVVRVPSRRADGTPLVIDLCVTASRAQDGVMSFHAILADRTNDAR